LAAVRLGLLVEVQRFVQKTMFLH